MRHAKVKPDTPELRAHRAALVAAFAGHWEATPSLMAMGLVPTGQGTVDDLSALEYVDYEGLHGMFAATPTGFLDLAAAVLGGCLVRLLHFEWCVIELPSGSMPGLRHPEREIRLPLEALIAAKLSSGASQYGLFEELFFDIYSMSFFWPLGSHCLEESYLILEEGEFERTWGFTVPADVRDRFQRLCDVDRDLAARLVGLEAYGWNGMPDWERVRMAIDVAENHFTSTASDNRAKRVHA